MTQTIQIHTLTSHSTHNLNRDDLGQPKSVTLFGKEYGRISSQCLKRSIRQHFQKSDEMHGKTAYRTRKMPKLVKEFLEEKGQPAKNIEMVVTELAGVAKKGKASAGDEETQLIFLTSAELDEIKNIALELCVETQGSKKAEAKTLIKERLKTLYTAKKFQDGVDIAMFGRMTTSDAFEDCEAAIQVAHAITTDPVRVQYDFFTAVDDFKDAEETGSGHMDEKKFNTGIFYKYATINVDQLRGNLNGDLEVTKKAILAFIEGFLLALPTGSQNSMAAHQHPFTTLITVGEGVNTNLTNAFAPGKKFTGSNPMETATQKLLHEYCEELEFYGSVKANRLAVVASRFLESAKEFQNSPVTRVKSIPALLDTIAKTLGEESE